jgi:putative zinc finger protein
MMHDNSHLSDEQLLLDVDGEISARDAKRVRAHLDACWSCRARRQELESAIAGFVRVYHRTFETKLPSMAGPRAVLRAQIEKLSTNESNLQTRWFGLLRKPAWKIAVTGLLFLGLFLSRADHQNWSRPPDVIVSIPNSKLTPGAAVLLDREAVCASTNTKNKAVSLGLQKKVFKEYGLEKAEPRAYEVDYLVTPALGGADDIRNLWPHSYSSTAWNARVKDTLEDRLREMVCDGSLDLRQAQREIAANWIAAYKKYFHTDRPLVGLQ